MSIPGTEAWMREKWGPPCNVRLVPVTLVPDYKADPGQGRTINVEKRAARAFKFFAWALQEYAPKYARHVDDIMDDWVYNCRHIGNDPSRPMSNHSWGTALDLDAVKNPYGSEGKIRNRREFLELVSEAGFRWGGAYTTTKDGMHFELIIGPAQVKTRFDRRGKPRIWFRRKLQKAGVL
jgi:hypothetical protein